MPSLLKKLFIPLTLCLLTSWYFAPNHSPILTQSTGNNANERAFTVNGFNPLPIKAGTPNPNRRYRIYVFPGDGTFTFGITPVVMNGTTPSANPFVYNYTYPAPSPTSGYTAFAEATEEYGDEVPPPERSNPTPVTGIVNPSTGSIAPPNFSGPFLITPVRNIVPGNELTYIVTYQNPADSYIPSLNGVVQFNYDSTKLHYLQADGYPSAADRYTGLIKPTNGTIQWTFDSLQRAEKRNIFLRFQTDAQTVPGSPVTPPPTVKFISPDATVLNSGHISTRDVTLLEHSIIATSYDPNQKTVSPASFCVDDEGFFDFMVTFQNNGYAPVKDVHIEDELDTLLADCCVSNPIYVQAMNPRTNGMTIQQNCTNGKFNVTLQNINLRGTQQQGYGHDFGEQETKGYIRFRVSKSCLGARPPCSAICNRATITFDCNPPIETNLALSRIKCNVNILDPNLPDTCTDCNEIIIDSLKTWVEASIGDSIFYDNLSVLHRAGWPKIDLSEYSHFKWYPADGLSDPFSANPRLTEVSTRTYTLVASGQCKRMIIYLPLRRYCPLNLNLVQTKVLTNCLPTYNLTLTANTFGNGIINPATLLWQDCTTGGAWDTTGLAPGKYYFSVKDPATGCFKEKWVDLPAQPLTLSDDASDCTYNPTITGSIGSTFTYAWTWFEPNNDTPITSNQAPPLDLTNKLGVQLTVTDPSNGCTVSVQIPVNEACQSSGIGINKWAVGGALGLALFPLIWFARRRKR